MNRRSLLGLGAATLGGAGLVAATPAAAYATASLPVRSMSAPRSIENPVIWFHAHQDDETLTLGPGIEEHVRAGRWNIAVLATDGSQSFVRNDLGMTYEAFSAARDAELSAAYALLGVDAAFPWGGRDGAFTVTQARVMVNYWVSRFPRASFKAQSYVDSSPDHRVIGQALREAWQKTPTLDVRFYVKRGDWALAPATSWETLGDRRTLAAGEAYGYLNPAENRYGIGHRSVRQEFADLAADPRTKVHGPA